MLGVIIAALAIGGGDARADYCVGTSCSGGQDGWHQHGCWDLHKAPDGGNPTSGRFSYCPAVAECWDQQDSTCEILSEWGFRLTDEECAASSDKLVADSGCATSVTDQLTQEKTRREQAARDAEENARKAAEAARRAEEAARAAEEVARQDEMAEGFGDLIGEDAPDVPDRYTPPADVKPAPPRPPPNNPWTLKSGKPLPPRGGIVDPDFLARVPCAICVSFTNGPPIDVKFVADSVPAHKAAAAAVAQDATSAAAHLDAAQKTNQVFGVPVAGAGGSGSFGAMPDPSVAVVAQDEAAVRAEPRLTSTPDPGLQDLNDEVANQQGKRVGRIAETSQGLVGDIVVPVAEMMDTLHDPTATPSVPFDVGSKVVRFWLVNGTQATTDVLTEALQEAVDAAADDLRSAMLEKANAGLEVINGVLTMVGARQLGSF